VAPVVVACFLVTAACGGGGESDGSSTGERSAEEVVARDRIAGVTDCRALENFAKGAYERWTTNVPERSDPRHRQALADQSVAETQAKELLPVGGRAER